MISLILLSLGLLWIIFAVICDIRTHEIPDWVSLSLVVFALGIRFFYSLFVQDLNFDIFWQGLIGFGIFFVLGNILYYGKMFAGGDAKLFMALGAVLPLFSFFNSNLNLFISFFVIFLFIGAVYGIGTIFFFVFKKFKKFKKGFLKEVEKRKLFYFFVLLFSIALIGFSFLNFFFIYAGLFIFILGIFNISAKAIDDSFMIKKVKLDKLTEGDWLYKDVKINKKTTIKATWDGLTKEEINLLKKKYKKPVKVRYGIPFSPVFLISYLILIFILFKDYFVFIKFLF